MNNACETVQAEIDALVASGQWSQRLYQLKLWLWANGCPTAEPPRLDQYWANDFTGYPPLSYTYPGDPSDRHPPGG